jgi:hypothetical protein
MNRVITLALLAYASVTAADPIETAGKKITKGAIETAKTEVKPGDIASGAREVSSGVLDSLTRRRAELSGDARAISVGVADGMFAELRANLGSNGDGPLALAIQSTIHNSMGGAMHDFTTEFQKSIRAQCNGSDADCAELVFKRFAYSIARSAAEGISAATPSSLAVYFALGGGFVVGVLMACMTALMIGQRRIREQMAKGGGTPVAVG